MLLHTHSRKRVSLFSSKISCSRVVSDTRSLALLILLTFYFNQYCYKERKKKFEEIQEEASSILCDGGGLHRGCEDEIVRQQDFPFVCFHLEVLLLMLLCLLSNSMNEFFHAKNVRIMWKDKVWVMYDKTCAAVCWYTKSSPRSKSYQDVTQEEKVYSDWVWKL